MQSTVVMLVLVLLLTVGGVLSCKPCTCSRDEDGNWFRMQVARCHSIELTSVPNAVKLRDDIQVLEIEGASIATINENQFVSFQNLQEIRIRSSHVSKVDRHAFKNMTNVTVINLNSNLITELPAGLFSNTPRLVKLWLNANKLTVLSKNVIVNLKYLKIVDLRSNQITSVEANSFINVPRLETVYLYNNLLTNLNMNIFDDSSNLKLFALHSNPWHCDQSLCDVMGAVVSRKLWGSQTIPSCATPQSMQGKKWNEVKEQVLLPECLCTLCDCERPTVARCSTPLRPARIPNTMPNNITHLNVTGQQLTTLKNNAFSTYEHLEELHLERNQINSIEIKAFLNLIDLLILNLAENKLTNIEINIFRPMVNLSRISLKKNNLMRLNKFIFYNLTMLKEIDLSFNNINLIERDCFMNVPSLTSIDLSNNKLQTLQLNVLGPDVKLELWYLEANPWICDEALCGVMDAVVVGVMWSTHPAPVCTAPSSFATKSWPDLPQHFQPHLITLDSNQEWIQTNRSITVRAARDFSLHCKYCFVSRIWWSVNGVRLPSSFVIKSREAPFISTLTMENVHKQDEGNYVCQAKQCPQCETAWIHVDVDLHLKGTQGLPQECGQVVSNGVTNIVNGTSAKKGDFPWHVAVYRLVGDEHKYQCGGSVINSLIIITAAHCFTDERAFRYPVEEFYIAAGKYYSDYNSAEDIYAQKRQVEEYHIPSEYRGYESNFAGDIAVVVLKRPFQMTNVVQPVCMSWDTAMEEQQLQHNNIGNVVGWGYVDPAVPKKSAELRLLNPPFIDREQCLNEVPANFRRWVTLDKFCAGFLNGASVCKGDSGGGLVFQWNNTDKYFIRGLASVGPLRKDTCDDFQYAVYTKISFYNLFIQNIIKTNPIAN